MLRNNFLFTSAKYSAQRTGASTTLSAGRWIAVVLFGVGDVWLALGRSIGSRVAKSFLLLPERTILSASVLLDLSNALLAWRR